MIAPPGILDTMPAKINIEIPFPIPLSVICSPSHIKNADPAVSVSTTDTSFNNEWEIRAELKNPIASAVDCNNAKPTVTNLVSCIIFFSAFFS